MNRADSVKIPFYYHPDFSGYDFGANHPFRGERFSRFIRELEVRFPEVYVRLDIRVPERADDDLILLSHTDSYIERVIALEKRGGFLSIDTQVLPGSVEAARLIVGSSVAVVGTAVREGMAVGFGGLHHAGRNYGEGFCIFNDIAVSAAALLADGFERILILDTDAHQGNGTMDIFYNEPKVLFISLHQNPLTLYPGRGFTDEIGRQEGTGYTVNIPMPVLADRPIYEMAMSEIVIPLIDEFQPEIIIRNGGCDPLYTDTLTNLGLDLDALSWLTRQVAGGAADRKVPLADLFLSGYGPYVAEGWLAILRGTINEPMELNIEEKRLNLTAGGREEMAEEMRKTLDELEVILRPYWKTFR